ncbi:MAG: ABC transporter ATP-binding protein [Nitrososphaerota archaeon]|nr:ABC transporter ATP-binding protein [Nitrososphaerota archaeon]
MAETAISVNDVSKVYKTKNGSVEAISGISFDVKRGEFLTIIGPSGCGKSTMLSMIAGLSFPTSGNIEVDGKQVTGPLPDNIAIAFQEPGLLPWRTVLKNVELGLETRNSIPKKQRSEIAKKYTDLVGLCGFEAKYPHQLSGGMKQRVAIARCLSLNADILLLDEPFGALDEQTRLSMGEELLKILSVTSKTVLLITHSIQEAVNLSDRVLVMSRRPGRVIENIKIELDRPRKMASIGFVKYMDEFWGLIRTTHSVTGD